MEYKLWWLVYCGMNAVICLLFRFALNAVQSALFLKKYACNSYIDLDVRILITVL